jgi:transposase
MDEFIKLLDKDLEYISHEIIEDIIYIRVKSTRSEVSCPYCNSLSTKVHSLYERNFQDLPIQGKKVTIIINNRKLFCSNENCSRKTFAEKYEFLSSHAKKTKRLDDEILNISMNVSSVTAAYLLKSSVANVGKSTVCSLLKKRYSKSR